MKKDRILNTGLMSLISSLGHTQTLVIGDAGLPVPKGVPCIDLSVVRGIPSFRDLLAAVAEELVVESAVYAEEADGKNPEIVSFMRETLPEVPLTAVPHEKFKKMTEDSMGIIRTGECSAYANIILVGGVNF